MVPAGSGEAQVALRLDGLARGTCASLGDPTVAGGGGRVNVSRGYKALSACS